MEEEVGAKLFVRDSHHVRLTAIGKTFVKDAHVVIDDYDRALERIEALSESYEENVRIGYLRNASKPFLSCFIMEVARRHPRVKIRYACMEFGEIRQALLSRKIDVAFTMDVDESLRANCDMKTIYEDRFDAIVSKNHPFANLGGVTTDMLADQKLLLPDGAAYPGMDDFVTRFLPDGIPQKDVAYYRDIDTLYLKVGLESYLGFSSEHNKKVFGNEVCFLPILDVPTNYLVRAMWLKGTNREGIEAVLDSLDSCSE